MTIGRNFLFAGILLLTLLIHLPSLPNGFTWLDHGDIEKDRAVVSIDKLPTAFLTRFGETGFYRPIVTIVNSIDNALYKTYAPGYHLTNVLLHIINTALIPLFLASFFSFSLSSKERVGSSTLRDERYRSDSNEVSSKIIPYSVLLAALIFGTHPLSSLPIGAISYRPELLMTLFILLTLIFYAKSQQTILLRYKLLTSLCFFLALCSKETALFLIPTFIIIWEVINIQNTRKTRSTGKFRSSDNQIIRQPDSLSILSFLKTFITTLLLLLLYISLRLHAVPDIWHTASSFPADLNHALGTRLYILGKLLLALVSPLPPSLSDTVPIVGITNSVSLITLFTILFVMIIPSLLKRGLGGVHQQYRTFFLALVLLGICLAPALSIIPVPRPGSPHYAYFAVIPFSMLILSLLESFPLSLRERARVRGTQLTITIGILWITIASLSTFLSGSHFSNDYTLFKPEITRDPHFLEAHFYLGNYYAQQKQYKLAEQAYKAALKTSPNFLAYSEPVSILINLSAVQYTEKNYPLADKTLTQAQHISPSSKLPFILYNRAVIAEEQKDYKKIAQLLSNKDLTSYPLAYLILADAFHNLHRNDEAIKTLKQSLPYWNSEQRRNVEALIQSQTKE